MNEEVPQAVRVCLWSYDIGKIDLSMPDHRQRIIQNVLNRGTTPAIEWLLDTFSKSEIADAIRESSVSEWNKKSLSLWSLVFEREPARQTRFG